MLLPLPRRWYIFIVFQRHHPYPLTKKQKKKKTFTMGAVSKKKNIGVSSPVSCGGLGPPLEKGVFGLLPLLRTLVLLAPRNSWPLWPRGDVVLFFSGKLCICCCCCRNCHRHNDKRRRIAVHPLPRLASCLRHDDGVLGTPSPPDTVIY